MDVGVSLGLGLNFNPDDDVTVRRENEVPEEKGRVSGTLKSYEN